jgi:hypothetical protein
MCIPEIMSCFAISHCVKTFKEEMYKDKNEKSKFENNNSLFKLYQQKQIA